MSPQVQRIYSILQDRQWHCPQEWGYADGHCKRITDLNRLLAKDGLEIKSEVCDCGQHISKVLKRKIVEIQNQVVREFLRDLPSVPKEKTVSLF